MEKAEVGSLIKILRHEGGAPPGTVVQVKSIDKFGDLAYDWIGTEWLATPNDDEVKYYEIITTECEMLRQQAKSFILMYEMGVLTESNLKSLRDGFKNALRD